MTLNWKDGEQLGTNVVEEKEEKKEREIPAVLEEAMESLTSKLIACYAKTEEIVGVFDNLEKMIEALEQELGVTLAIAADELAPDDWFLLVEEETGELVITFSVFEEDVVYSYKKTEDATSQS